MIKKRIIIIGDHNNAKMCQILDTYGVEYDSAETLEKACKMVFKEKVNYDGIVLDVNFPESDGCRPTSSGRVLLHLLEQKEYDIPVLINSSVLNPPESNLVVGRMFPWELYKFEQFLNVIKNKD